MRMNSPDQRILKNTSQPLINFSYSNMKERSNSSASLTPAIIPSQIRRQAETKPHQSLPPLQFKSVQQPQIRQQFIQQPQQAARPLPISPAQHRVVKQGPQVVQAATRPAPTAKKQNPRTQPQATSNAPLVPSSPPVGPSSPPATLLISDDLILSPQGSAANLMSTATTNQVNMLRQERVITVDQSDFKLELEVMKIKYKTLEERYQKLEAELNKATQQEDSHKKPYQNHTVIEEEEVPSSTERDHTEEDKGKMSEIISRRVDQEVEHFKVETQERQQQIKAKYDEYFVKLRNQNENLVSHLRERDEVIAAMQKGMSSNQDFQKLIYIIRDRENQVMDLKNRLGEFQRRFAENHKKLQIMETEIQRCNNEIIKKNTEIMNLKNHPTTSLINSSQSQQTDKEELKQARFQIERLNEIIENKQNEVNSFLQRVEKFQQLLTEVHNQRDSYRHKLQSINDNSSKTSFQLSKATETIHIKQQQVIELQQERDKLRRKVQTLSEEQAKDRQQSKVRIGQLEHKVVEVERLSKITEQSLRENIRRMTEAQRSLANESEQRLSKIRLLEVQIGEVMGMIEKERTDHQIQIHSYEEKLYTSQRTKVEIEGTLNRVTLQLEQRKQQDKTKPDPETATNRLKAEVAELTEELSKMRIEVEKKNAELESKRVEFESNMRRFRQECEDSYRDTLRAYEERIQELEKKRHRRKELGLQNSHREPRLSSESRRHEPDGADESMLELQDRISDFLQRINQLIDDKSIKPNSSSDSLKILVTDLNSKIRQFRHENSKLRHKIHRKKHTENKLRQYEHENKKLMDSYGLHGQKVEQLVAEVNRLRTLAQEYELAIYHGQVGRQFAPKGTQGQLEERIKMLEDKAEFYKEKNTDMEGRINSLINLNSSLKIQLEQATRTPGNANIDFLTQQMLKAQENVVKLQEQVRRAQDETSQLRSQQQSKVQQLQKDNLIKVSELEAKIVQLNLKTAGMKSQKTICENDLKLTKETLSHREALVEELSQKLHAARREIADLTADSRKKQELQAALREASTKYSSLIMQKNHLESDNSNTKKHNSYLQKQLLSSNQKLSAMGSSHLTLQLQLTQSKATLSHTEKRIHDLQQQIRHLQKYRSDFDAASNDDRARMGHLEGKLRDLYYQLEKANKEKEAALLELGIIKSQYGQQKEHLIRMNQERKEIQMELSRLRTVNIENNSVRPSSQHSGRPVSSSSKDQEKKSYIHHLQSTINQIKNQLMKTQAERAALQEQLTHVRNVVEPEFTSKIRELEQILQHVSVSVEARNQSPQRTQNQGQSQEGIQLAALTEQFKKLYHRSIEMEEEIHRAREGQRLALGKIQNTDQEKIIKIRQLEEQVEKLTNNIESMSKLLQQKDMLLNISTKQFEEKMEKLQKRYKSIESLTETSDLKNSNGNVQILQKNAKVYEHMAITISFYDFLIQKIRNNCVELEALFEQAWHRPKQQNIHELISMNIAASIASTDEAFKISEAIDCLKSNLS